MKDIKIQSKVRNSKHHQISPMGMLVLFGAIFTFVFLIFNAQVVHAARLYFESPTDTVGVGERFLLNLMIDSEGETINAVEGSIVVSHKRLKIVGIEDGSSIVTLWVRRPEFTGSTVTFSGVVPGGFDSVLTPLASPLRQPGLILSLLLEGKSVGEVRIDIPRARVLLHDGVGTEALLKREGLTLQVVEFSLLPDLFKERDRELPEPFKPEISQAEGLFNDKYFLVFATTDKGSGIDYYEVNERRGRRVEDYDDLDWKRAESPVILSDQTLRSFIYVKAVDRNGNMRVAVVFPSDQRDKNTRVLMYGILILLGILAVLCFVRRK